MKKIPLFILILKVLIGFQIYAQNDVTLNGVVRDIKSGEAIIGATINIKGTVYGTVTDYEGSFKIKSKLPLPIRLVVSYIGFQPTEIEVNSSAKPIIIKLKENARELKEVSIKDSRITLKQKQAPLTIETMDAIAIKETPAANFYEGLAHLKGVDLTSASIGFKIINTRGFNSTSPVRSLQLIDGVDNQSPGLNFSLGNFLGASELDVQRVDLIVGASSAYYGPNAFNGVINMQTKNPFLYPGLSVQMKMGERNLTEMSIRYAEVFKNKKGEEKLAYKLNVFAMSALDWQAENYEKTSQSPVDEKNPGGYDAVNRYGDEYSFAGFRQSGSTFFYGYGYALRSGYKELDLVDYNSKNLKLGATVHYKVKKDVELIFASSFGSGTTVYQGDNRFSLKDILFNQNRIELRKENNFFLRVYNTKENAGNSYDAYATAILLQNYSRSDRDYATKDYASYWGTYVYDRISKLFPDPRYAPPGVVFDETYVNKYLYENYYDSLVMYHGIVKRLAESNPNQGIGRYEPGTARFDSAFNAVTSLTNREGGSKFFDLSALYHVAGEKQFKVKELDIRFGGNMRLYKPNSNGTIFLDTAGVPKISNHEVGAYLGLEHKFVDNKLKISLTNRLDKNQNFNLLWSPAGSFVYTHKQSVFRLSLASAIRNPTLTDQYINLNVGRATLLGNLNGFKNLATVESLINAFNYGKNQLSYFDVPAIKPERVKTIELGYRGNLTDKIFVDMSYYFSWYQDFIGYKIGTDVLWKDLDPFPTYVKVYRVSANAKDEVTTQGFSIGANYFYQKYLSFSANYSWNKLDRKGSLDPLIPAFNTPEHKYNLGINGREIESKIFGLNLSNWGYAINWKEQTGFNFEGSPQFTGYVPAYGMMDVQINKLFTKEKITMKLGASNVLNNKVIQVYGGPRVGRMAYFSLLFDFNQ